MNFNEYLAELFELALYEKSSELSDREKRLLLNACKVVADKFG